METTRPTRPSQPKKGPQGPLTFQPLNEGLGFHPFSEGLPYAPVSKPQAPRAPMTGSGAVSAGRPSFGPIPNIAPAQPSSAQIKPTLNSAPASISATIQEAALTNTFGYMFRRVWAYLFDTMLNFSIVGAGIAAALWRQDVPSDIFLSSGVLLLSAAFAGFFSWALITSQEIAFGTSIGKRVFGLSLNASSSVIVIRAVLFVPILLLGGLGLLTALFNSRRSCLHDLILGAQPIDVWREEN